MRKISVLFSPSLPHPELFNTVGRKILSTLFQSKVSLDGAKGKLNLPQKHSHTEMLDAPAPELGIQGTISSKMFMLFVEGGITECLMPWMLQGTICQSRSHPSI